MEELTRPQADGWLYALAENLYLTERDRAAKSEFQDRRTVALVDSEKLRRQFLNLERRTARGGRDSIDHPRGLHDDLANAVAGVLVHAKLVPGAAPPANFNRPLELPPLSIA